MRKYLTEFGLNVFTSYKTIVRAEDLDEIKDNKKYHIYMILSLPKAIIDINSIIVDEKDFSIRMKDLNSRLEELKDELQDIDLDVDNIEIEEIDPEVIKTMLRGFHTVFEANDDMEQKKRLLHLLIDEITVDEDRNLENIRIALNKDVAEYLRIKGESGEPGSPIFMSRSHDMIGGEIILDLVI